MRMDGQDESLNVEDVRGSGGGLRPIHGIGLGTIALALIGGWLFGVNPLQLLGLLSGAGPAGPGVLVAQPAAHLLGILGEVNLRRGRADPVQSNALSVRLELQADCLAGVWATRSQRQQGWRLEPGDIDSALNAASRIGDDTLQRRERGVVVPDSFTHGTGAQRVAWFRRGVQSGRIEGCDTFSAAAL